MKFSYILVITTLLFVTACAKVNVTKTGQGFYEPTNPAQISIMKTVPEKKYTELGTVTVSGFSSVESAKMHNAIRAKAAGLGANAVILTEEGLIPTGWGNYDRWATGVAIHFDEAT